MTTKVINIRDAPPGWQTDPQYVYIGRAMPRKGLKASKWGNPFKIGRDGDRKQVLFFFLMNTREALVKDAARELRGKTLVCWCHPLPCHGDVLARWADAGGDE